MKNSDAILKRQRFPIRFKNEDMDFWLNWILGVGEIVGLSHGEIFYAIAELKDGDPVGWREGFRQEGHSLRQRADTFEQRQQRGAAGQPSLAAAYAYRASLQYPTNCATSSQTA
jgi:hypothetical protein